MPTLVPCDAAFAKAVKADGVFVLENGNAAICENLADALLPCGGEAYRRGLWLPHQVSIRHVLCKVCGRREGRESGFRWWGSLGTSVVNHSLVRLPEFFCDWAGCDEGVIRRKAEFDFSEPGVGFDVWIKLKVFLGYNGAIDCRLNGFFVSPRVRPFSRPVEVSPEDFSEIWYCHV